MAPRSARGNFDGLLEMLFVSDLRERYLLVVELWRRSLFLCDGRDRWAGVTEPVTEMT